MRRHIQEWWLLLGRVLLGLVLPAALVLGLEGVLEMGWGGLVAFEHGATQAVFDGPDGSGMGVGAAVRGAARRWTRSPRWHQSARDC